MIFNSTKFLFRQILNSLGYDLIHYPYDPIVNQRTINSALQDCLCKIFLTRDIDNVLDVGGHYGEYAEFLRNKVGYEITQVTALSSFLKPNTYAKSKFNGSAISETEIVTVRRLDSLNKKYIDDLEKYKTFLKLDTQGFDIEVIMGAGELIKYIVALQIEVSVVQLYEHQKNYLESISFLNGLGFELLGLFPVSQDEQLRVIEFDCLMGRI